MGKYATKEQLTALVADMASKINIASGTQGVSGSYVPIGCIEAFMGVEAPPDFLVCDGSLHSIASYPQLADHFYEQFGASNHFGGNGTTTFAVPDLRGEFLRGTGTNGHEKQGSGANVGVHQDGTQHKNFATESSNNTLYVGKKGTTGYTPKTDSVIDKGTDGTWFHSLTLDANNKSVDMYYTSRPTNTSVLWCIKAIDEKIQPGGGDYPVMFDESEDEYQIGWYKYANGTKKPVYRKMFKQTTLTNNNWNTVATLDSTYELQEIKGVIHNSSINHTYSLGGSSSSTDIRSVAFYNATTHTLGVFMARENDSWDYAKVTIEYTKTTDTPQ